VCHHSPPPIIFGHQTGQFDSAFGQQKGKSTKVWLENLEFSLRGKFEYDVQNASKLLNYEKYGVSTRL